MKKLLVPTDFSENAQHALDYAIALSKVLGGDIHLVHSYQTASGTGQLVALDDATQKSLEGQMSNIIKETKKHVSSGSHVDGHVLHDHVVDSVVEEAAHQKSDYIVMGTLGASGIKKLLMGSTTSNVIRNTEIPVLAIPDDAPKFKLKTILLALGTEVIPDAAILNPVLNLAKQFGATVSLLHITSKKDEAINPNIQEYIKSKGVSFVYHKLEDESGSSAILEFAKDKHIDLICALNRQRSWFSQLFQTNVAQQLTFKTNIPLLVLKG